MFFARIFEFFRSLDSQSSLFRNGKALTTNRDGKQRSKFFGSRLPTASVQADCRSGGLAGSEQRQRLREMKAVAEQNRRERAPEGWDGLLPYGW